MASGKSIVRVEIEKISGVVGTWFEWDSGGDPFRTILVVAISSSTDPEEADFNKSLLEEISSEVSHVLNTQTTMVVSGLRIVPALVYNADRT